MEDGKEMMKMIRMYNIQKITYFFKTSLSLNLDYHIEEDFWQIKLSLNEN